MKNGIIKVQTEVTSTGGVTLMQWSTQTAIGSKIYQLHLKMHTKTKNKI